MTNKDAIIVFSVLAGALVFICGFALGSNRHFEGENTSLKTKVETRIDTIRIEKPVYVDRYFRDSVIVAVKDTILVHDTTYMYLPREHRVYMDSMYRAIVSGIEPRLDSIEVYNPTSIVTIETLRPSKQRSRWSISLHAGYGICPTGLTPTISAGVSYSLFYLGR